MSVHHPHCQRCSRLLLASVLITRTGNRHIRTHRGSAQGTPQYEWKCRRCQHVWWSPYAWVPGREERSRRAWTGSPIQGVALPRQPTEVIR